MLKALRERAYAIVFLAAAFLIGASLYRLAGSSLGAQAAPAVARLGQSVVAAIGFGLFFAVLVMVFHAVFRIAVWQSELLLLQLLPAVAMGVCYARFRALEPPGNYNSGAFLLLGGIWLFNRADLKTALLAQRTRAWGRAAIFCAAVFLAGLLGIAWFPFGWAGVPVFLSGLIVIMGTEPDQAKAAASIPPLASPAEPGAAHHARQGSRHGVRLAVCLLAGILAIGFVAFVRGRTPESLLGQRMLAFVGSTDAQFKLGWRYREGRGVALDFSQAAVWFEKTARSGSARGQYDLGTLYYYGLGVPEDSAAARAWFERAAGQDYAPAVSMLGLIAANDDGDPDKALELWQRAAALKYVWAEYLLGLAYLKQHSASPDSQTSEVKMTRALYWLEKARRDGVEPVGGLLQQVWMLVPDDSVERVRHEVFQRLQEGTAR